MNKREFLDKLNEYLSYELPAAMVRDKLNYYSAYIDNETAAGRTNAEVIESLGDPQLIARSIIDAAKSGPDGIPGTDDDVDFGENIAQNRRAQGDYGSTAYGGAAGSGQPGTVTEDGSPADSRADNSFNPWGGIHVYNMGCLTFMLIMFAVFTVIGALLQVLSPVLAPICIIMLVVWLINRLSGGGR